MSDKKMFGIILKFLCFVPAMVMTSTISHCGGKPADVFFLLDSSGSIDRQDFQKELRFAEDVTDMFEIGPERVRVGALSFSATVTPHIALGQYTDKLDLLDNLSQIQYEGLGTNTGDALKYLHEQGMPVSSARSATPRIAIILTDGQSQNMEATLREAKRVHDSGISVFAIGIGTQVDEDELRVVASHPSTEFVFQVDDFDALQYIKDSLAIRACEVKPIQTASALKAEVEEELARYGSCIPRNSLDIVFAVDTASIGASNAQFALSFIGNTSERLNMDTGDTSIATVGNGCSGGSWEELPSTDAVSVKQGLASFQAPKFTAMMRSMRLKAADGRRSSLHVGVVFLGDKLSSAEYRKAQREAKRANYQKTSIFVIGVGNRVDDVQAKSLTIRGGKFYHVMNFDVIDQIGDSLLFNLCLFGIDSKQ